MTALLLELRVTITAPSGIVLDVSSRIDGEDLGSINETAEGELLELTHGDMDFDLVDDDSEIADFFASAKPSDLYVVEVMREGSGRRSGWNRVFAGVLDLPWSVRIDRKEKRVSVTAFSNSKLLERSSAETVRRTVEGRTISASSGSTASTINSTTDILKGDKCTAADADGDEQNEVASVNSGTSITWVNAWSRTFTGATLTLDTPYLRNKTVEHLAAQVFDAAGIATYEINIAEQPLASYPVATELNTDGLPGGLPRSIVEKAGQIVITFNPQGRQGADSTQSGFVDLDAVTNGHIDWRPYLATEPGTIQAHSAGDIGTVAADHTGGHVYNTVATVNPEPGGTTLVLEQDGSPVDTIDTFADPDDEGYEFRYVEYDPSLDQVWASYKRFQDGIPRTRIYDVGTDTSSTLTTSYAGQLRYVKPLDRMAMLDGTTLYLWNTTTQAITQTVTGLPSGTYLWTLHVWASFAAYLYASGSTTRCRVHDKDSWVQLADFEVANSIGGFRFLTVFDNGSAGDEDGLVGVGYAGGRYFVLSRHFDGVIAYADFDGLSCAGAERELALVSLATVTVDHHGVGHLRSRTFIDTSRPDLELPDPLEQDTTPVWELYANSVEVIGEDEDGEEIRVVTGDTGDSAHRLSLESRLITHESQAQIVGAMYHGFLSALRTQEDVTVDEAELDEPARPFDRVVTMQGRRFVVLEAETDLMDREQDLVLAEIV